jgi:hypothetical protein
MHKGIFRKLKYGRKFRIVQLKFGRDLQYLTGVEELLKC